MKRELKVFSRRLVCLVLALICVMAYVPSTPNAQAIPIAPPIPPPPFLPYPSDFSSPNFGFYYDPWTGELRNYVFEDIVALFDVMGAAHRTAGFQYVEPIPGWMGSGGTYVPSTDNIGHMLEAYTAIYNALDAAAQSEIWQQAQKLPGAWASGAQSIVQFGSDLISKVQGKHKELYPAMNVQYFNGVSVGDYPGLTINELVNIIPISEIDSGGYIVKFIHISNSFRFYRINGTFVDYNVTPTVNSNEILLMPLIRYNYHPSLGWKFFYIGWGVMRLDTRDIFFRGGNPVGIGDLCLTPPSKVVNDAPPIHDMPPVVAIPLSPALPGADPYIDMLRRMAEINAKSMDDILSFSGTGTDDDNPGDIIIDGKDRLDELTDLVLNLTNQLTQLQGDLVNTLSMIDSIQHQLDEIMQEIERLRVLAEAGEGESDVENEELSEDEIENAIESINDNDKNHILQDKHNWDKLVPDPKDPNSWHKIATIIYTVLKYGQNEPYKGVRSKAFEIGGEIIQVTYKYVDGILRISDAWVKNLP